MQHSQHLPDDTPAEPSASTRPPTLLSRLRRAFGRTAPGGASSTPSPTQGRSSGTSAPGWRSRPSAKGRLAGRSGPRAAPTRTSSTPPSSRSFAPHPPPNRRPHERAPQSVQPTIRRFTGTKRTVRVGPLRFTGDEHAALQEAAAEHGYKGESGFTADIALAFITGRFTANLPLSEDRRRTHMFRAQVLRELNRIGVNVNQIARALNSDLTPPDVRDRLDELHHLLDLLAGALCEPAEAEKEQAA